MQVHRPLFWWFDLGVGCTGTQWQPVIAFAVLVGVLMIRPTGLLGEQVGA